VILVHKANFVSKILTAEFSKNQKCLAPESSQAVKVDPKPFAPTRYGINIILVTMGIFFCDDDGLFAYCVVLCEKKKRTLEGALCVTNSSLFTYPPYSIIIMNIIKKIQGKAENLAGEAENIVRKVQQ